MKIRFLGTGTSHGVPVIACDCEVCTSEDLRDQRLRSSILIEIQDKSIVVDTGPDFRQQMLREKIKKVDAILFTHQHKDHTGGLDDIRAFNYLSNNEMPVFGRKEVLEQLKQEYAYIFHSVRYPGVPDVKLHEITKDKFAFDGIDIQPIEVLHHKLPVFGFRLHDFAYITDANFISEEELEKLKGVKTLVVNSLRREKHISHFSLEEALALISYIRPERAYLTHVSHRLGLFKDVSAELPEGVELAYDGLTIECI